MAEIATLYEIEGKTKVNSNLYKVPVELISFYECSEGRPLQGSTIVHWIIEAKSPQAAVLDLTKSPAYWKNWNSYPKEVRKLLIENHYEPFRINLETKIEEIPACKERHKTEIGDYVCGVPCTEGEPDIHGINGDFGDCLCQNFWASEKDELKQCCPYRDILKD